MGRSKTTVVWEEILNFKLYENKRLLLFCYFALSLALNISYSNRIRKKYHIISDEKRMKESKNRIKTGTILKISHFYITFLILLMLFEHYITSKAMNIKLKIFPRNLSSAFLSFSQCISLRSSSIEISEKAKLSLIQTIAFSHQNRSKKENILKNITFCPSHSF